MTVKNTNKYLVAIAGPTAVGKTRIAIEIASHFNTEIVSADSRQVYRKMSIGTAKPSAEELDQVSHHFIDTLDIGQAYSVGKFERDAVQLLETLFLSHDLVILAGGTGLYHRAVLEGLDSLPEASESIRKKWERIFDDQGLHTLQERLQVLDPEYAAEVDLQNPRRVLRALTVIEQTGLPFSQLRKNQAASRPWTPIRIFLNEDREKLYQRINHRVEMMMAQGLLAEVRSLIGFKSAQALQTVGYRELIDYLEERCTLDEAVDKIKQHSRNYAKRQVTWFRNQGEWWECNPPDTREVIQYIEAKIKAT